MCRANKSVTFNFDFLEILRCSKAFCSNYFWGGGEKKKPGEKIFNEVLTICTNHQILFGWSNQRKWNWQDMWHAWVSLKMHMGVRCDKRNERDHFEGRDVPTTTAWTSILKQQDERASTGFIWLMIRKLAGCIEHVNQPSVFVECDAFPEQ
jgi:hypothetical protein